ncbi:uncharacterized [Tachysurus ichikawai]
MQSNHEGTGKVRQQNSAELSGSTAILHKSAAGDRPERHLQAFWAEAKTENGSQRPESFAFKKHCIIVASPFQKPAVPWFLV